MERTTGELITAVWEAWKTTDVAGADFVINLQSGLVIMVVEVLIVVGLIGWLLNFLEKRKWSKTRQALAYALLRSMNKVMQNALNMIHQLERNESGEDFDNEGYGKEDERGIAFVLNSHFELHLLKLNATLATFNEITIVHLPALLPDISENLSDITRKISGLEEAAAALKYHFYNIERFLPSISEQSGVKEFYDSSYRLSPHRFNRDAADKKLDLKAGEDQSDNNYFYLTYVQLLERATSLSANIQSYIDVYHNAWKKFPGIREAENKQREFHELAAAITSRVVSIGHYGMYLVLCTPPASAVTKNRGDHGLY